MNFLGSEFGLQWFTPTNEVALCGHATLAAAAVLFNVEGGLSNDVCSYSPQSTKAEVAYICSKGSLKCNHFLNLNNHCIFDECAVQAYVPCKNNQENLCCRLVENSNTTLTFHTLSGKLFAKKVQDMVSIDLPANPPVPLVS